MWPVLYDPVEYEVLTDHRPCPYHCTNPAGTFSGCTCMSGITLIKRSPARCAEVLAERGHRQREQN